MDHWRQTFKFDILILPPRHFFEFRMRNRGMERKGKRERYRERKGDNFEA